jgi:hypothetical protein
MRFDLVRPCADCPFRSDRHFELRRSPELAREIFEQDQTFACHHTTQARRRRWQHCAGALILHEKQGRPNWRIRFAHAAGSVIRRPSIAKCRHLTLTRRVGLSIGISAVGG